MLKEAEIEAWNGHVLMRPEKGTVVVTIAGHEVARSTRAIHFVEGERAAVYYIPRSDVALDLFAPSDKTSRCRWKGDASYMHFDNRETRRDNALWYYPDAFDEVSAIRDCVAFDLTAAEISVVG